MAISKSTVIDGLHVTIVNGLVNAAHVSQFQLVSENGVEISRLRIPPVPVAATGPLSLAGVLSSALAAALAGAPALQAQIENLIDDKVALNTAHGAEIIAKDSVILEKNSRISDLTTTLAALQAKYDLIAPPVTIPMKFIRMALNKLGLASAWGAAVEATIATLEQAKDPNPKHVYNWWYEASEVNIEGGEGSFIVVEMCKADAWGTSSLAALLALAKSIQAETVSSPTEAI